MRIIISKHEDHRYRIRLLRTYYYWSGLESTDPNPCDYVTNQAMVEHYPRTLYPTHK